MYKKEQETGKAALQKRKLSRTAIAIAVISVAITGGLAAFLCSDTIQSALNLPWKNSINEAIPGLLNIIFLTIISIILSIVVAKLLLKQLFRTDDAEPEAEFYETDNQFSKQDTEEETGVRTDINNTPPKPVLQGELSNDNDPMQTLTSEKLFNSLLMSILHKDKPGEVVPEQVLSKLGAFCQGDYAAYYTVDESNSEFNKKYAWDAKPDTARHSNKVDSLKPGVYQWMFEKLRNGKVFVFRTAMLDGLIESTTQTLDDAKAWLQHKADETAEYKLCKHEAWQYIIGLPCYTDKAITGLFLLGYESNNLPVSQENQERLGSIASALGSLMQSPGTVSITPTASSDLPAAAMNLMDAVFTTTADGFITMANPAACKLSGVLLSKVIGQAWKDVFLLVSSESRLPIEDPINLIKFSARNYPLADSTLLLTPDGKELPVEGICAAIQSNQGLISGAIFILRDVTHKLDAENERMKEQRLDAVSSLSAGLAHDFNNLLTAILGNISLVLDDLPADSEQAQTLKAAEECTLRGKDITDRLLSLVKSSPATETATEISAALPVSNPKLVLVLDEEDMLGNLLIKTLAKMGLQVEKTSRPDELLYLFSQSQKSGNPALLILMDLNIPSESDITTIAMQIKKADKKVKVIAYSNMHHLDDMEELSSKGFDDILLKPFNITALKDLINKNLDL